MLGKFKNDQMHMREKKEEGGLVQGRVSVNSSSIWETVGRE